MQAGSERPVPYRGLAYVVLAAPMMLALPTVMSACAMCLAGLAHCWAAHRKEEGDASGVRSKPYLDVVGAWERLRACCAGGGGGGGDGDDGDDDDDDDEDPSATGGGGFAARAAAWWRLKRQQDESGKIVFIAVYVLINVALFVWRLDQFYGKVGACPEALPAAQQGTEQEKVACLSLYGPWAKAFGMLLNFNCSAILYPVLKKFIAWLNNKTFRQGKRSIATYIPLRKNVVFHKVIAKVVFWCVFAHVFFHYANFALRPEATLAAFDAVAWVTGGLIVVAMVVIYSGTQPRVKRQSKIGYNIFLGSHHFFALFFGALLFHGPEFWMWGAVPLLMYVFERVLKARGDANRFLLLSVRFIDKKAEIEALEGQGGAAAAAKLKQLKAITEVMELRWRPEYPERWPFRAGTYVDLQVPYLGEEWHPFTISSSPGDLEKSGYVTLHIRVMGPGSWTMRLRDYLLLLNPNPRDKRSAKLGFKLARIDRDGRRAEGKLVGPDGRPLIRVNGPHSAPAVHYSEYKSVMLVGAGVGLTPSAAVLREVVRHKWAKGFRPDIIRFYWVVRHTELESFAWFVEELRNLEVKAARDRAAGSLTAGNELELNVYVTRVPKKEADRLKRLSFGNRLGSKRDLMRRAGADVDVGFDAQALMAALCNPPARAKEQAAWQGGDHAQRASAPNRLGQHVWVWNGRPDWNAIFARVAANRRGDVKRVGVCFCGASVIGKDLKKHCRKYSSLERDLIFKLHKENF